MDDRNTIINDVINSLQSQQLTTEQIEAIKNSLTINLNEYEIQKRETAVVPLENPSETLLKQFIATKRVEGKAMSTLKRYYYEISNMIHAIQKPVKDITTFDLRFYLASYQETHNISNRTLDGMRRCIKSFFTFLFNEGILQTNPSAALSQIRYEKQIKHPFSDTDLEKLKRSCENKRDRALVEFLYSTGCRVSEVVSLNRSSVDFSSNSVIILGKGNKQRVVYLTEVCAMYLQEYLQSRTDADECLFASTRAPYNRISKNGIEAILRRLGNAAGVSNVHPHRYRRTLATNLLDRGANIQNVAAILGHEDLKTTQIYCYISQQNVQTSHQRYVS